MRGIILVFLIGCAEVAFSQTPQVVYPGGCNSPSGFLQSSDEGVHCVAPPVHDGFICLNGVCTREGWEQYQPKPTPKWDHFAAIHTELFALFFGYGVLGLLVLLILKTHKVYYFEAETDRMRAQWDHEVDLIEANKKDDEDDDEDE